MHLFGLIAYAALYTFISGQIPRYPDGTAFTLLQQLTLTHNIGLNPNGLSWNIPSWSISVEFWINVVFIAYVSRSTRSTSLLLSSLACLILIFNLSGNLDTSNKNYYSILNSGLIRAWASFAFGLLAYRAWLAIKDRPTQQSYLLLVQLSLIALCVIAFCYSSDSLKSIEIFTPALFAAVIISFSLTPTLLTKILSRFKWLGTISYSIYLNHLVILMICDQLASNIGISKLQMFPGYILAVILVSSLTYKLIEVPGKRFTLKLAKKYL